MSSIKRLCLRDKTQRDSFDERICDDLSEVILQYLPIEDKFKFERVSKQFQRTIFQRQYELQIKDSIYLESILKKCPKINSLNFRLKSNEDSEQIVDLIVKYCNNLVEINGYLDINEKTKQRLVQTFNKKCFTLKCEETYHKKGYIDVFQFISDIKELHIKYSKPLKYYQAYNNLLEIRSGKTSNLVELGNFKTLAIKFYPHWNSPLDQFETLIENNPQIEKFYFSFNSDLDSILGQISKLKNLVDLRLWNQSWKPILPNGFEILATNCPLIKSISLFRFDIPKVSELLSVLKQFKQLKRLELSLSKRSFSSDLFKAFTGFENLTHLTLVCKTNNQPLDDTFLTDIDIFLPNLRYLDIDKGFTPTEHTIDILSRLSRLETLILKISNFPVHFPQSLTAKLLKTCKYIRTIQLIDVY